MTAQAYFNAQEAAEYLRMSRDSIKAAIADGRLRAKKTGKGGGGHHRFSRADLDAFFDSMEDA